VHIEIQAPVGHLLLRIQHSQLKNDQVDCAKPPHEGMGDRALALADAIVSGAGGEFSVTTYPFLIVADFPVKRERAEPARSAKTSCPILPVRSWP